MVAERIYNLIPTGIPKVVGELPATADDMVAIMEFGGLAGTEYFATPEMNPTIFKPVVKIAIRNKNYSAGATWAEQIKFTLHRYSDDFFLSIMAVSNPVYLGRNELKSHEFQITFNTRVKE